MPAGGSAGMHSQGSIAYFGVSGQSPPTNRGVNNTGITSVGWLTLGELIDADLPAIVPGKTKLTHLGSPIKTHEFVPGQKDPGELRLRYNYTIALHVIFANLVPGAAANPETPANDWARKQFLFVMPDNGYAYTFGFLAGFPAKVPEDDRIELEVTITLSGPITYGTLAP